MSEHLTDQEKQKTASARRDFAQGVKEHARNVS